MTPPRIPSGTYRLQFGRTFTFADAERLVPYLAELGVSHLYASPYLKARSGSTHGYDLTDYNALNPEVGDDAGLAALVAALARHDMGQILDFVPNHMGIGKADNEWWLDVLEWGRASPYADYFDIDWAPAKVELRNKVLLPLLGDHYGRVLERGELKVAFDAAAGSFGVWYHEHLFPIRPAHYGDILAPYLARRRGSAEVGPAALDSLDAMARRAPRLRVGGLPIPRRAAIREEALRYKDDLATLAAAPDIRDVIEGAVDAFNGAPDVTRSFLPLHRLLERQAYRLAYWRVAADEINYRRFFDINELAGVKMERAALFDVAHRLVLRLIAEGSLNGLRIDHIDGLYDPAQYCRRLTERASAARPPPSGRQDQPAIYLVVEKILARHESLRRDWPIDGTTGYEILNLINGLFVDPEAEKAIDQIYRQFLGRTAAFDDIVYASKKHVMRAVLASELQVLANALDRISESNWRTRDFTLSDLRAALEEVAACFPVYRTYVGDRGATIEDRRDIDWAVGSARRHAGDLEGSIFDFVHAVLTTDLVRRRRSGYSRRSVVDFARRFQQFTGPVMAKALEDTSFYRFNRLLSLNEVGGDPRRFGVTVAAFHYVNQERARLWPGAMTTTATHDMKRGEDVRVRIDALTEMPREWASRVRHWATLNRRAKSGAAGRPIPGRNDEYFLYQTLVGAWPSELMDAQCLDVAALDGLRTRIEACMIKAAREAKIHSSWTQPNADYEEALRSFVRRILDAEASRLFLTDLVEFVTGIARLGMVNGLAQTLLKLAMPGVPDLYQGAELWDLSLVDPDNRRPVDFEHRRTMLAELRRQFPDGRRADAAALRALLNAWPDGQVKLLLVARLLRLRREHDALFREGAYVPFAVTGRHAEHVCAFARVAGNEALIVAVPRLVAKLGGAERPPLGLRWADTTVLCSPAIAVDGWTDVLTGAPVPTEVGDGGATVAASLLFAQLPVAALLGRLGAAAPVA